jgi:hypothetical protein
MIYFIRVNGTGPIKIGYTKDPERRLMNLQGSSPYPLAMIGLRKGTISDEKCLHNIYQKHRVSDGGKEWYNPTKEILQEAKKSRV